MKLRSLHPWDVSMEEAIAIQRRLAPMVSCVNGIPARVRYIAGVDISGPSSQGVVQAAVAVLSFPDLELVELGLAKGVPPFPYVPGLLSFREMPVLQVALESLRSSPDILIADGHGLAHPRRFGLACHLGLLADIPTIGCAKSVLVGVHGPLALEMGSQAELVDGGEVVGLALRTRANVSPVYVSVGHKVDLTTAARWVLALCVGTRLPETTRQAHRAAGAASPTGNGAFSREMGGLRTGGPGTPRGPTPTSVH